MSTTLEAVAEPWQQLPGEHVRRFEAFALYRDMGTERSIREVARRLRKSVTLIGRWSSQDGWVDRVAAWQAYQDRQLREWQQEERREAVRRLHRLSLKRLEVAEEWVDKLTPAKRARLSAGQVTQMTAAAAKDLLLSVGASTENVHNEHSGAVAMPGLVEQARKMAENPEAMALALEALDKIAEAG